jgi:hypothetical protein
MIIKLFRENQIFTILLTLLLSSLVGLLVILTKEFTPGVSSIYYKSLFAIVPTLKSINDFKILSTCLNILLILLCGFYLSRITVKYQIFPIRSLLPMFVFFILSIPYFAEYSGFSYPLLTLLVLLSALDMFFANIDLKGTSYRFFDGALLISTASLLNIYFIFFIGFVFVVWIQFRGYKWREFIFILLGTIVPYLVVFSMLYLTDISFSPIVNEFKNIAQIHSIISYNNNSLYYMIGFIGFMTLASSVQILRDYVKMKIVVRKYSLVFLLLFLFVLLLALVFPLIERDIIFFFALPLSFLFSYYFNNCKINIFNQILLLVLIFGSIALALI